MPVETRTPAQPPSYTLFIGESSLASGDLRAVLLRAKAQADRGGPKDVLLFEDETGRQLEVSLEGPLEGVLARALPAEPAPGRGRPKLGVTAREVTLLPRHWEWLEQQPRGTSATLRLLVDEARKREPDEGARRIAREAAHRFMTAMSGNRAGYEEALRALYAADRRSFEHHTEQWPKDVRRYTWKIARASFG
jgi:hypothetical protein